MARKRRSEQQWQALIEAQQTSGLTVNQFCTEHNITLSNFYLRRKKHVEQSVSDDSSVDNWLPLQNVMQVNQDERHWQIELTLPNGVVLNMRTDSGQ